ncbi:MAG: 2-dehydropantoate 2-reductase [Thermoproteota archaeon]|nr:2-dehydropantoate 2-reductase [Thermoproteota archaeon]
MRFIVYGAGGIGSTIGGHLFRSGHNVVLVANPKHVDKIQESGLRLVTSDETFVLNIPAVKDASELKPFRDDDVILLTAKSQHTLLCLGQLKNAGASRVLPIFCCQNSMCNEPLATRVFDRIYGAELNIPAIFLEPGEVINPISGNTGFIEVGLYPRGADELASVVSTALKKAGFAGGVNEWVMKAKGAKCLSNLSNAMGAITDGRGNSEEFMKEARREAETVWSAAGIEWEDWSSFNRRIRMSRGITRMPKGYEKQRNLGSSWQSLMRGTGNIEAEELNGDVVKLGRLLGIPTPYNELLWRLAGEMAEKKEKPGKYTTEDLIKMVKQ